MFHSKSSRTFLEAVRELIVPPNGLEKLSLAPPSVGASKLNGEEWETAAPNEAAVPAVTVTTPDFTLLCTHGEVTH